MTSIEDSFMEATLSMYALEQNWLQMQKLLAKFLSTWTFLVLSHQTYLPDTSKMSQLEGKLLLAGTVNLSTHIGKIYSACVLTIVATNLTKPEKRKILVQSSININPSPVIL